jgi:site-specific DNA-methyltransferase (adenine-specific)
MKHLNKFKTFNIDEKTPKALYDQLNNEFHFDLDPCPLFSILNGLKVPWYGNIFINPPYSRGVKNWILKAIEEINKGNCKRVVFLLPAYTDTKLFHEMILPLADEIRFIKGRLKFSDHENSAPFASMIVIY